MSSNASIYFNLNLDTTLLFSLIGFGLDGNGIKIGTWCENIKFDKDRKYNMAISMTAGQYSVQLIDFKMMKSDS